MDEDNSLVFYQPSIKKVGRNYYAELYWEPDTFSIEDQLEIIKFFPSYVSSEDNLSIFRPVTLS